MRRRLAFAAAGSAFALIFGAVPAFADNGPHTPGAGGVLPDTCAGCHRIHTAKTDMLTKDVQPALCYTCHGTTGSGASTDVQGGVAYAPATVTANDRATKVGALRGGGFEYALIDSSNPTGQSGVLPTVPKNVPALPLGTIAPVTSSHSVDGSTQTAWGNGPVGTAAVGTAIQLRCGSCHDPHGNGNYRILKPLPEQGTTSPLSTIDPLLAPIVPVFTGVIADATVKNYTTTNYWNSDDVNSPLVPGSTTQTAFIANVSQWCSTCHTRYLATRDKTGANTTPAMRSRFDSGDATFTYRHTSNDNKAGGKNCITCHVSHGSNAAMGPVSSEASNPSIPATGSSKLLRIDNRGTCRMCHNV